MTKPLFKLTLDSAFEETIGPNGANKLRYNHFLDAISAKLPRMRSEPAREAAPIFNLPSQTDDLGEIEAIGKWVSQHCKTLVVVGMGGSSLSGETLASIHPNPKVELVFVDNIDPHNTELLTQHLDWKHAAFLIISKSGNTIETLAQMALLLRKAKAADADISKHFFVITIPNDNPLHAIAKAHGMKVLAHDANLGGRFAILSSVGLLPAAAIGMDIRAIREGACKVLQVNFDAAPGCAARSAALHLALMEKNTHIHVMMHYGDRMGKLASWYRQCWAESLGKCPQATTPVRSRGATDQHSQLQLYLDGPKDKLFTLMQLDCKGQGESIEFPGLADKRLDFLKGHTLGDLMAAEQHGTLATLVKRGCPVRSFEMQDINEEVLGGLLMHFTLEIVFTAELLAVNAFDQPAVEEGKILALHYLANG